MLANGQDDARMVGKRQEEGQDVDSKYGVDQAQAWGVLPFLPATLASILAIILSFGQHPGDHPCHLSAFCHHAG